MNSFPSYGEYYPRSQQLIVGNRFTPNAVLVPTNIEETVVNKFHHVFYGHAEINGVKHTWSAESDKTTKRNGEYGYELHHLSIVPTKG